MRHIILFLLVLFFAHSSYPQDMEYLRDKHEKMHDSKQEQLEDFNEAKFGMFVHWGLYSIPAGMWEGEKVEGYGEWILNHDHIPLTEYRQLAKQFNPVNFDAEEWIKLAKDAGMRYFVIVAKHHDGFAMYNSDVSDFNVVDATPFKRDPMRELYNACKKHDIEFGIYYSHALDWMDGGDAGIADYRATHPEEDWRYTGSEKFPPIQNNWDPTPESYKGYLETKAKPQMRELLYKFPDAFEIWYDVPIRMTPVQSYEFYKLAYDIQPNCLINGRVGNNFGDFSERGDNEVPEEVKPDTYWETSGTLNNSYAYVSWDKDWKSTEELLYWLVSIASKGGNYLLNVGPKADGTISQINVKTLRTIGQFMDANGEAIYGTEAWKVNHEGPVEIGIEGTTSRKEEGFNKSVSSKDFWFTKEGNNIYVIALTWPKESTIQVKSLAGEVDANTIQNIELLGADKELQWQMNAQSLNVELPLKDKPTETGYALKIKIK